MDRIALAKRLEGLSRVFANETPFNRDLKAMSYVLSKLPEEKFATILAKDFSPDVGITDEIEACGCGVGPRGPMGPPALEDGKKIIILKTPEDEEAAVMSAEATDKTAGMYWNKESSEAVVNYLLRDVVGMEKTVCCDTGSKLEANQVPDGSHKGLPETPKTLTPEQTPDVAASLDTDMVKKSEGPVRKEAGTKKGPGVPDATGPMSGTPKCPLSKKDTKESSENEAEEKKATENSEKESAENKSAEVAEKESAEKESEEKEAQISEIEKKRAEQKRGEAERAEERSEKAKEKEEAKEKEKEETSEEDKESCMKKEASFSSFEGIELAASMDEATLNDAEAEMLSKLFD